MEKKMTNGQKRIIALCDALQEKVTETELSKTLADSIAALKDEVVERELVVPVVGAFSAGKSSMINACIGGKVLPEAVTPETSLATELHYASQEFAEAVKKDGSVVRYEVSEMDKLTADAKDYSYARLYLNRAPLKEIEPLVLVDMPGFDSPLDHHNKAIMTYLDRGCYYIVLSSVEEGTITKSLLRHLREITGFERGFSFFLSKANLRSDKVISELAAHYETTLRDNLDLDISVKPLGNASAEDVLKNLKAIDTDELFFSIYQNRIKALFYQFIELLNIRISASKKDEQKNRNLVAEMENSVKKIQDKADALVNEVQQHYSGAAVGDIVNEVGMELDRSLDELVSIAKSGNQTEAARRINEIVRSTLTGALKAKMSSLINQISTDFSSELSDLGAMMSEYDSPDYMAQFAEKVGAITGDLQVSDQKSKSAKNRTFLIGYEAILGVASLITGGVITIMEAIVIFLPEALSPIISFFQKKKIEKELRQKFQIEVFPGIKQKIRSELQTQLNSEITRIIEEIRDQYQEKIDAQRVEVEASIESAKKDAEAIQKQAAHFEVICRDVKKLVEQIA
jgi:DNA-binding protein Fis